MKMPASASGSATGVGGDVVVVAGRGNVLLDLGGVLLDEGRTGIVVVASVVLAAVDVGDGGVNDGPVDTVGATAGNEALGAHPAATSTTTTSAFDLTVPPTTEATVVRALR